ncbi:molybdopterin synthase catalytic subunit MoaE [uncultured Psychromonas sp.]|uniref:molybdopterin synthase catalytic subunit MoaE n=1 Tax=uncultured Psychromonas sp. TaxID=173974 RepID=UPI00261BBE67|nr:molybdopterin synthase catalytic subunit MoaE [uncultured Psychromonas sp.]
MISVQELDFNQQVEYDRLKSTTKIGAIVTFTGLVRDINEGQQVSDLALEHYPGMTEKCLQDIVEQAQQRWNIIDFSVIHRVGQLAISDQIVFVGIASQHRGDAFAACEFIMDYLKTQAPFWKKETMANGETKWVDARDHDQHALTKWQS